MDIMMLVLLGHFALKGTTWRLPLALLAFYIVRFLVQVSTARLNSAQFMFKMRYPEGYLWHFPGFFSIFVPYGRTNDFFFSGHIGASVIGYSEAKALKLHKFSAFCIVVCVYQFMLMVFMRGHYFIDLLTGCVMGHYIWMTAQNYSFIID